MSLDPSRLVCAMVLCALTTACSSVVLRRVDDDAGTGDPNDPNNTDPNGQVGPVGPRGPLGPVGPAGSPGATGANGTNAVVWKDAAGQLVPIVFVSISDPRLPELFFADPAGLVWRIDVNTASVTVAFDGLSRLYTTLNCSGTEYLYAPSALGPQINAVPPPRFTFKLAGDSIIRSRPDGLTLSPVMDCSTKGAGACVHSSTCSFSLPSIPLAPTQPSFPINPPPVNFVPPLHPEQG